MPNSSANRSKRCNGSSTCSKRGGTPWPQRKTRAAFRSRGTHRQHERNHPPGHAANDQRSGENRHLQRQFVEIRPRQRVCQGQFDLHQILGHGHAVPVQGISAVGDACTLAIDLVDSLKCYHYPHKGSIRPNTASAIAGDIRESIFRLKRAIPFMRPSTAGSASRSTTGAVTSNT